MRYLQSSIPSLYQEVSYFYLKFFKADQQFVPIFSQALRVYHQIIDPFPSGEKWSS